MTTLDARSVADENESRSVSQGFRLTAALLLVLLAVTGISQYTSSFEPGSGARLRTVDQLVWPQQWAFFATESDAHLLAAYRLAPDGSLAPETVSQMSAQNQRGLGGESTAQFIELEMIESRVPAADWVRCGVMTTSTCLARATATTMPNAFQPALLCGPTVLLKSPTTPSTTTASPAAVNAASVAVVHLTCADD